jgi:hypothetical protein
MCTDAMVLYCTWVRVNFSIMFADRITLSEYSLGESVILLRHSRDIESATSLASPEMTSKLKEYSESAINHLTIIGFEFSVMYRRLR